MVYFLCPNWSIVFGWPQRIVNLENQDKLIKITYIPHMGDLGIYTHDEYEKPKPEGACLRSKLWLKVVALHSIQNKLLVLFGS